MHMVINVLVQGDDKDEALGNAEMILQDLSGEGKTFDYYSLFVEKGYETCGIGRWGKIGDGAISITKKLMNEIEALDISGLESLGDIEEKDSDHEVGKKLLVNSLIWTMNSAREALAEIREKLNSDPEKLLDDHEFRRACRVLGEYRGYDTWIYTEDYDSIRTKSELIDFFKENKNKLWIVPADVHF